ncbi:hypothetical protein [Streptomyces sp. NPDC058751]|uniref:hypothetical protein n=1 Tax=Streptomyces sp. NPDC058751 TaxID=3346623 RepID=UPI003692E71E
MSNGAGRGTVGRLLLLLLLALGLMHLLAHAGSAETGPGQGTVAHAHAVHPEPPAQREGPVPPLATAHDEHGDHGTWNTAELGLCAAAIGCCALLAVGGRRLHGRRVALFLRLRRRIQAAWSNVCQPPLTRLSQGLDIAQLAVLRI